MSERALPFRQGDVTRALKAIVKAGQTVRTIRITPGGEIAIDLGSPDDIKSGNEWDTVLKK